MIFVLLAQKENSSQIVNLKFDEIEKNSKVLYRILYIFVKFEPVFIYFDFLQYFMVYSILAVKITSLSAGLQASFQ